MTFYGWSNIHLLPSIKRYIALWEQVNKFSDTSLEVLWNFNEIIRASINFQTQEVPNFLSLRFGSPIGKSRKSHFFPAVCPLLNRTQVLISVSKRIIMIYTSFRCVLKMSLSLIKIRSHLFGNPVLVCWTLEKASTLHLFQIPEKEKRKKKIMRQKAQNLCS